MIITLYRVDEKERIHYYSIHDRQISLFDECLLTTTYFIDSGKARESTKAFASRSVMDAYIRKLYKQKQDVGYKYLYGFNRFKKTDLGSYFDNEEELQVISAR